MNTHGACCCSPAREIERRIRQGVYPENSALPSRPELAEYCPYWIDFRLAASWIGESVIVAHQEHAEQLQHNVPWKTSRV